MAGQDGGSAIALVNVEINDGHAQASVILLHPVAGHRSIVKAAVARPKVAMRMMRSAGQVKGHSRSRPIGLFACC